MERGCSYEQQASCRGGNRLSSIRLKPWVARSVLKSTLLWGGRCWLWLWAQEPSHIFIIGNTRVHKIFGCDSQNRQPAEHWVNQAKHKYDVSHEMSIKGSSSIKKPLILIPQVIKLTFFIKSNKLTFISCGGTYTFEAAGVHGLALRNGII